MKLRWKTPGQWAPALAIIAFFLLDRALSIGLFLPQYCVEDERWVRDGALEMLQNLSVSPGTHKYPQLEFTLTAGAYGLVYAAANFSALPGFESFDSFKWHIRHYHFPFEETIVFGRLLGAILGALALWLLYLVARREFGEGAALAATFLCATTPTFLFTTNLIKNDPLVAIAALAATHAALRIVDRGAIRDYVLAGVSIGFALAAKYHAVAAAPFLIILARRHWKKETGKDELYSWLIVGLGAMGTFMLLSPWTFIDWHGALRQAPIEWALQNKLNPLFRRSPELWWQKPVLFQFSSALPLAMGAPVCLMALLGAWFRLNLKDWRRLLFFSYPAGFLLFMIFMSELGVPHLYASAAPFFALLAALLLEPWLRAESRLKRAGAVIVVGAAAAYNLFLFHGFTKLEDYILRAPTAAMALSHEPGEKDLAFVPYYPNPEINWTMEFLPQFALSRETLAARDADRIMIHQAYYNAYKDNPELMDNAKVARMRKTYLELRLGGLGYTEKDRWVGTSFGSSFYGRIWPDLEGLRASVFVRNAGPNKAREEVE